MQKNGALDPHMTKIGVMKFEESLNFMEILSKGLIAHREFSFLSKAYKGFQESLLTNYQPKNSSKNSF